MQNCNNCTSTKKFLPLVLNHSVCWNQMSEYLKVDPDNAPAIQLNSRKCSLGKLTVTPKILGELQKCGIRTKLSMGESIDLPQVCLGFKMTENDGSLVTRYIYLSVTGDDKFLQQLFRRNIPENVAFHIDVTSLKVNERNSQASNNLTAIFQPNNTHEKTDVQVLYWSCGVKEIKRSWANEDIEWKSVFCLGLSFNVSNQPTDFSLANVTRKLLTDELLSDATIVVENGTEIKCHRSILAAQSGFFAGVFQTNMSETRTGTVQLPGMQEESVRALLQFLYTRETKSPLENSGVCVDLLQAGDKYDIPNLTEKMNAILLSMSPGWFSEDVAVRLYLFSRAAEMEDLREKSMKVLKLKFKKLKDTSYNELFIKNKGAAMELIEFFIESSCCVYERAVSDSETSDGADQ